MFEANPATEFEHFLAAKLSRTVDQLRQEMSSAEFVNWCVYYDRRAQSLELERLRAAGR